MSNKTLNAWKAGCARQLLLYLGTGAVVLVGLAILVAFAFLAPGPQATPDNRAGFLMVGLLAEFGIALAAILTWGAIQIWRCSILLDRAFAPAGLRGKAYPLNRRQYHDEIHGRYIDVLFFRVPVFAIPLSTNLQARFPLRCAAGTIVAVGTHDDLGLSLARQAGFSPLETGDPAYRDLAASAFDTAWGRNLLTDPAARELFFRLTPHQRPL